MTQLQVGGGRTQPSLEAELARELERGLRRSNQKARWVQARAKVPRIELSSAMGQSEGLAWLSPQLRVATSGASRVLLGSGKDRFIQLKEQADELLAELRAAGVRARLFGGASFLPGGATEDPWAGFGDARLVLPRFSLEQKGGSTTLCLTAPADAHLGDLNGELRELLRPNPIRAHEISSVEHLGESEWTRLVEEARAAIADGQLVKTVLARRSVVRCHGAVNESSVLQALTERYPGCVSFAFRGGDSVFTGASPEPLLRRDGDRLRTEALAGSAAAGEPIQQLLESTKDRHEHRLVVDAIRERLSPFIESISIGELVAKQLANVTHLQTPIEAKLKPGVSSLDLLEALHPTPAVGCVPREASERWIQDHEPSPRGWYSGPVGYIDTEGRAEFFVALRSALLHGEQMWAFAGAGIVADSNPAREYEETGWKLKPVLEAAGVR